MNQNEPKAPMPKPLFDMGESLKYSLKGGYVGAAVILMYSYLDTLVSLTIPEGQDKVTRTDFINWVNKYMKTEPGQPYQYDGKDFYAARCGIIHQYSPFSDYGEKEQCKLFVYSNLNDHTFNPTVDSVLVVISATRLINDFFIAISRFIKDLLSNKHLMNLASKRMNSLFAIEKMDAHQ